MTLIDKKFERVNEFSAKKLGEVLAFADVSLDTAKRAENALQEAFGKENFSAMVAKNTGYIETIRKIAEDENVADIVDKKLEGTGQKLLSMRDLYIGDEWNNPTELLEWFGFFLGAAIVHWQLVKGSAEALNHQSLKNLADDALKFHQDLFNEAQIKLNQIGREKSI